MNVKLRDYKDNWENIKNATMTTINKSTGKYPDSEWKRKLLLSEHSPIRKLKVGWVWEDIMSWVSVHFVRHKTGIEHFVSSKRSDRNGIPREELSQCELVNHECDANAQALIFMSRKRLCHCASTETRQAMVKLLDDIVAPIEPELRSVCVKECVYRNGFCPEMFSCGYNHTKAFEKELKEYLKGIESQVNKNTLISDVC